MEQARDQCDVESNPSALLAVRRFILNRKPRYFAKGFLSDLEQAKGRTKSRGTLRLQRLIQTFGKAGLACKSQPSKAIHVRGNTAGSVKVLNRHADCESA